MNFNPWNLIAGFLFGIVGFYVFRNGKKAANFSLTAIGLVLMVYPYFIENTLLIWGVGFALCGLIYKMR